MNKVILMGRLVRDPEIRYSQSAEPMCVARYTLAVDRRGRRDNNNGEPNADFISCVCFGKSGEFAEKYLRKGIKITVSGRIQTGSYTNREGNKVYTTDVVVEEQEFAESKNASANSGYNQGMIPTPSNASADGFMTIPDSIEGDLPFK
jgi:single-strand DNA-binding protein